ncbi:MAG: serine protease Do [Candidatus Parcubacteria bacterium]|jgi:serine protease Do|nr:serine protease Do [Candidatus Parcubacteria bacterium]
MNAEIATKLLVIVAFLAALGVGLFNFDQTLSLRKDIGNLQSSIASLNENQASTSRKVKAAEQELATRPASVLKSQDQILTAVVAKTAPAVVSIVISRDVPNLVVSYVNPFGDDPMYQDFGFAVPVYEEKGTTHQKVGAGSGFLISHDGYILTNKHVVEDASAEYTVLLSNGAQKTATVVSRDPNNDVAILHIDGTYPTIALFGDSSSVKLGQTVLAIGNALGEYGNSVSVGIISGLNRTINASDPSGNPEELAGVFQTDAAINPGNSGGPLVDLDGNVVGINVATVYGSSNISFSIPVNMIQSALRGYK